MIAINGSHEYIVLEMGNMAAAAKRTGIINELTKDMDFFAGFGEEASFLVMV